MEVQSTGEFSNSMDDDVTMTVTLKIIKIPVQIIAPTLYEDG